MDISKLFKWSKEYTILDSNGLPLLDKDEKPIKFYIRVIGDLDQDQARKYALTESKKLRESFQKELHTVLPELADLAVEELAALAVLNEASVIYKQVERDTIIPYPRDSESLRLIDEENFLAEMETYFERLSEEINKKASEAIEKRKLQLQSFSRDDLVRLVERTYLDKILESEMVKAYNDAILYYAIYEDENFRNKAFKDILDVRNSSSFLKEQLYNEYSKLVLKDTELKK